MTCDCAENEERTVITRPCQRHLLWAREYAVTVFEARVAAAEATASGGMKR